MFYWFDPIYLLFILPGILVGIWAQVKLSSTYSKYRRVATLSGVTGAEAAREVLDRSGLRNVPVREVPGHLTDHYDPLKRALFLSSENYHGHSVAAVGVAAHEAGHALQHQAAYAPLKLRMAMVPITRFSSMAWVGFLVLGFIIQPLLSKMIILAIVLFSITTFFQLVTLPVEFDASRRAKQQLSRFGIVQADESAGVERVLNAAALTYVAALVMSVLQLLYLLSLANRRG